MFEICFILLFLVLNSYIGEVAEWLKAHAWKACKRETVSRVRIPLSPPFYIHTQQIRVYSLTHESFKLYLRAVEGD